MSHAADLTGWDKHGVSHANASSDDAIARHSCVGMSSPWQGQHQRGPANRAARSPGARGGPGRSRRTRTYTSASCARPGSPAACLLLALPPHRQLQHLDWMSRLVYRKLAGTTATFELVTCACHMHDSQPDLCWPSLSPSPAADMTLAQLCTGGLLDSCLVSARWRVRVRLQPPSALSWSCLPVSSCRHVNG